VRSGPAVVQFLFRGNPVNTWLGGEEVPLGGAGGHAIDLGFLFPLLTADSCKKES